MSEKTGIIKEIDPFTLEIVKDSLVAIGDEMFYALQRTSKSTIIYEVLDYASGLTDSKGRLLAQGNGVTGFLGTLDFSVKDVIEKFAEKGNLHPGDIIITNDPYGGGGTHLSDVCLAMPIFYDGELVAFSANKAHWTEVGGKDPGSWTTDSTEVYQEGLQFPCIKIFEEGKPIQSLIDLIAANVRMPDMTLGDLWAGVAALRVGERRFIETCDKYGKDTVMAGIEKLLDNGEQLTRLELAKLPHGVFEAEDYIDDDGQIFYRGYYFYLPDRLQSLPGIFHPTPAYPKKNPPLLSPGGQCVNLFFLHTNSHSAAAADGCSRTSLLKQLIGMAHLPEIVTVVRAPHYLNISSPLLKSNPG
jgi:N-methylhydantoinase B